MKARLIIFILIGCLASITHVSAQCKILNRVAPDGTMQYYMEPANLYQTKTKSLQGCILTDKESYFIELHPFPIPVKPEGKKLKEDLLLKLADGSKYTLRHYDTRYAENDTVLEMLFLIGKEDIDKLMNYEVTELEIDMKGDEGIRPYILKLRKNALKEQLSCFLKEEEKRRKK